LDTYNCLPANKNCAEKWLKDKQHLNNCACLEQKAKETYELFANSLKEKQEKLEKCACETSEKVRINNDDYTKCESCEETITAASKKRVIKNRNDPKFWGLNVAKKVLCGECLTNYQGKMPARKKYLFSEYQKRGYWK